MTEKTGVYKQGNNGNVLTNIVDGSTVVSEKALEEIDADLKAFLCVEENAHKSEYCVIQKENQ